MWKNSMKCLTYNSLKLRFYSSVHIFLWDFTWGSEMQFLCILFAQFPDTWLGAPCCTNGLSFLIRNIIKNWFILQYSSLIRFIYVKTLVMGLNVLKNKREISVFCKAHFNIIALSNRWNCLKAHLCQNCKVWSISLGTAELLWPQVHPLQRLLHLWEALGLDTKPACSCVWWHPLSAREGLSITCPEQRQHTIS